MITSNTALKSSESQLSNAGSTIKIGHFLEDIKSSEIKVSKPEISEFFKKLNFASTNFKFRKQINNNYFNYLKLWSEFEAFQERTNWLYFNSKSFSSSDLMSIPIKHFMLRQFNLKYFFDIKDKNLDFDFNCWWGGSSKYTLILKQFGVLELQKRWYTFEKTNQCLFWHLIDFPKFRGIREISQFFLKGNETL